MPTLQVRDLPEVVYEALKQSAERDNRSIAQQTITLLEVSLGLRKPSVESYREFISHIQKHPIAKASDFSNPANLIREDRDR